MSATKGGRVLGLGDMRFTVGITTRNRPILVIRAIESVLSQNWPGTEVVVVDDASTDSPFSIIRGYGGKVKYVYHPEQQGPNAGRNHIIRQATTPWVLLLDDDDALVPDALALIARSLERSTELGPYPVYWFATTNAWMDGSFAIVRLEHLLNGTLRGDFTPVIRRDIFLEKGLAYPTSRVGGENLLWWHVAERYGIPTWSIPIVRVGEDAPTRLTSVRHQVEHAADYAALQQQILELYGELLRSRFPSEWRRRKLALAVYRLLSGHKQAARNTVRDLFALSRTAIALWALSFAPMFVVRFLFTIYRKATRPKRPLRHQRLFR